MLRLEVVYRCKPGQREAFHRELCAIGAREDLGRPTTTARENKENFMAYLAKL